MSPHRPGSRRIFTDAARKAALLSRQRKREEARPLDTPEIFVVRLPMQPRRFGWEIRRFGGVVLGNSAVAYETLGAAQEAGLLALIGFEAGA